ncbi:MAG: outer membrane protein assembly factor BamD [Pseudomonadales bacterium]
MRLLSAIALFALLLGGCSSNEEAPLEAGQSEKQLYKAAEERMQSSNFEQAVKNFQMLEAQFPFGPYAEQAQLELIYAYYRSFQYEASIEAANRFIRLHPQHPNVDYAYYLRGLANYNEGKGMFDRYVATDMTERDPGSARQSFNDFSELLRRFPDSEYAPDANARMVYLRNLLARHEINVANYYLRRGAVLAAAKRGRYAVEHYPKTPAVSDGLAIMVQSYLLLGYDDLAADSLRVLKENYPDHENLTKDGDFIPAYTAKGAKQNWLSTMTLGLFGATRPKEINNKVEVR